MRDGNLVRPDEELEGGAAAVRVVALRQQVSRFRLCLRLWRWWYQNVGDICLVDEAPVRQDLQAMHGDWGRRKRLSGVVLHLST